MHKLCLMVQHVGMVLEQQQEALITVMQLLLETR